MGSPAGNSGRRPGRPGELAALPAEIDGNSWGLPSADKLIDVTPEAAAAAVPRPRTPPDDMQ